MLADNATQRIEESVGASVEVLIATQRLHRRPLVVTDRGGRVSDPRAIRGNPKPMPGWQLVNALEAGAMSVHNEVELEELAQHFAIRTRFKVTEGAKCFYFRGEY